MHHIWNLEEEMEGLIEELNEANMDENEEILKKWHLKIVNLDITCVRMNEPIPH